MALRSLSTSALRAEIARREKGATRLQQKHSQLAARLAEIESELAELGVNGAARRGRPPGRRGPGRPPGRRGPGRPPKAGRRGRGRNALSLPAMLAKAVRVGSTVSPADAGAAVKKAGYQSASKTFGVQVAIALAKSPDFKRTGRGQYLRKGGASAAPAKRGPKPKMGRRGGRKARRGRKPGRPKGSKNKRPATAAAAPAAS